MILTVESRAEVDHWLDLIEDATRRAIGIVAAIDDPLVALRRMKFERIGFHPIEGRALNFIEQVNQTFTYTVALEAAAWLLCRHPEAGGFRLAPGATMALPLDIMSIVPDVVGAETFTATHPGSNRKLVKDLAKLAETTCRHRYAFFYAPGYAPGRAETLERVPGVEVRCIDIRRPAPVLAGA